MLLVQTRKKFPADRRLARWVVFIWGVQATFCFVPSEVISQRDTQICSFTQWWNCFVFGVDA